MNAHDGAPVAIISRGKLQTWPFTLSLSHLIVCPTRRQRSTLDHVAGVLQRGTLFGRTCSLRTFFSFKSSTRNRKTGVAWCFSVVVSCILYIVTAYHPALSPDTTSFSFLLHRLVPP